MGHKQANGCCGFRHLRRQCVKQACTSGLMSSRAFGCGRLLIHTRRPGATFFIKRRSAKLLSPYSSMFPAIYALGAIATTGHAKTSIAHPPETHVRNVTQRFAMHGRNSTTLSKCRRERAHKKIIP
jgi:hypothetical protein